MKKLLLFLLLPLFSNAQNVAIGTLANDGVNYFYGIAAVAKSQTDSVFEMDKYPFIHTTYKDSTHLGVKTSDGVSDVVAIQFSNDTFFTRYEYMGCNTHCNSQGCYDCITTLACGCSCTSGDGLCDQRNYGVAMPMSLSKLVARYLILINGNELPKD